MSKYIIKDWADNACFQGRQFDNFDDAWGYIYELYDGLSENEFDAQMGEYWVMQCD
jgi:hypothetical protein